MLPRTFASRTKIQRTTGTIALTAAAALLLSACGSGQAQSEPKNESSPSASAPSSSPSASPSSTSSSSPSAQPSTSTKPKETGKPAPKQDGSAGGATGASPGAGQGAPGAPNTSQGGSGQAGAGQNGNGQNRTLPQPPVAPATQRCIGATYIYGEFKGTNCALAKSTIDLIKAGKSTRSGDAITVSNGMICGTEIPRRPTNPSALICGFKNPKDSQFSASFVAWLPANAPAQYK